MDRFRGNLVGPLVHRDGYDTCHIDLNPDINTLKVCWLVGMFHLIVAQVIM